MIIQLNLRVNNGLNSLNEKLSSLISHRGDYYFVLVCLNNKFAKNRQKMKRYEYIWNVLKPLSHSFAFLPVHDATIQPASL